MTVCAVYAWDALVAGSDDYMPCKEVRIFSAGSDDEAVEEAKKKGREINPSVKLIGLFVVLRFFDLPSTGVPSH